MLRLLYLLVLHTAASHPQENRREARLDEEGTNSIGYHQEYSCGGRANLTASSRFTIQNPVGALQNEPCEWLLQGYCAWEMSCTRFNLGDDSCGSSLQIVNNTDYHIFCGSSIPSKVTFRGSKLTLRYFPKETLDNADENGFLCNIDCRIPVEHLLSFTHYIKPDKRVTIARNSSKSFDCDCGDVSLLTKIVNGRTVRENVYPWMAGIAIKNRKEPVCGGVLINSQYVLTAAHCIGSSEPKDLEIRLMHYSHDTTSWSPSIVAEVENIFEHPEYTYYMDYDVALIKLKTQVALQTSEIWNICLPHLSHRGAEWAGITATISGWGRIDTNLEQSQQLQHSNVTVISREECAKIYASPEAITDSMMCAHGKDTNICEGDSGGPLMSKIDGMDQFTVLGLASWLSQEGCLSKPGVFARVPEALPWIQETVGNTKACRTTKKEH